MASIQIELNPFSVPSEVTLKQEVGRREDGLRPVQVLKLSELSYEVLDALCEEFRENVMRAADQRDQRKIDYWK